MSHLEKIEMVCLDYLANSSDPWVPFSGLYAKCKEVLGESIVEKEIFEFILHHSEIRVFNTISIIHPEFERYLSERGIKLEPFVILRSRMPKESDLMRWMINHIENLIKILEKDQNTSIHGERKAKIEELVQKANKLKRKISFYLENNSKDHRDVYPST
ncbi:MAG: hypothetical protein N3G21_09900 [Candidatus Hydrogenedentes bacterium]|nr:hypothetical protein [Candidatus Hydrogenedentota bacterium]